MAQPPLSTTAQRLYDAVAPMAYDDEANGWALALFCQAMALTLDEAADLSRDEDDGSPGYSGLFDADTIPAKLLPWLGQLIGVAVPTDQPEAVQRARIKSTDGFQRGTPGAIIGAAQAHLTGTQTVYLIERHGSAYRLTVSTLQSETPTSDWDTLVNLLPNPSAEVNATDGGWVGSSATIARTVAQAAFGSAAFQLTLTAATGSMRHSTARVACEAGKTYSAGASFRSAANARTCRVYIDFYDSGGTRVLLSAGADVTDATSGWTRATQSVVAPATAVTMQIIAEVTGAASGDVHYIDGLWLGEADVAPDYFDGRTAGYRWQGTADDSPSERIPTTIVHDAVMAQKPAGIVLDTQVIVGGDFNTLRDTHATFDAVTAVASFTDFYAVRDDPSAQ